MIFHVENHPQVTWFEQCVTFHFFPTPSHELAYNLFNILSIYVLPLLVIIVCYSMILWEISRKTMESKSKIVLQLLLYKTMESKSKIDLQL